MASKAPLLSDEQMRELYEQIFDEPVSVEILFSMLDAHRRDTTGAEFRRSEWVMDGRMLNRIRRLVESSGMPIWRPAPPYFELTLYGLPVAVEPLAKLALRVHRD